MKTLITLLMAQLMWMASPSMANEDRIARLSELSTVELQQLMNGQLPNVTVEFRKGDKLPVKVDVQGGFLESDGSSTTNLLVKATFYVKVKKNRFYMSLDGHDFDPIKSVIEGELGVGVAGSPATEIQVMLKAFLKEKK